MCQLPPGAPPHLVPSSRELHGVRSLMSPCHTWESGEVEPRVVPSGCRRQAGNLCADLRVAFRWA